MAKHRHGAGDQKKGRPPIRRWVGLGVAAIGCGLLRGLGEWIWTHFFGRNGDGPGPL